MSVADYALAATVLLTGIEAISILRRTRRETIFRDRARELYHRQRASFAAGNLELDGRHDAAELVRAEERGRLRRAALDRRFAK